MTGEADTRAAIRDIRASLHRIELMLTKLMELEGPGREESVFMAIDPGKDV